MARTNIGYCIRMAVLAASLCWMAGGALRDYHEVAHSGQAGFASL